MVSSITIVLVALVLSACSSGVKDGAEDENKTVETRKITHELGEAEVSLNPKRVIVLEQGFTEVVAALGVKLVGVADDNKPERLPKEALKKIEGYKSVGQRSQPNLEVIRTLNPDLIIADLDRHKNIYEELEKIAPTVVLKNQDATYTDTVDVTKKIGEALGKKEDAEKLVADHNEKVNGIKNQLNKEKSVLFVSAGDEGVFDGNTSSFFLPSFLTGLGVNYALQDEKEVSKEMTVEQILKLNPDILIVSINEEEASVKEKMKDDKLWNQLTAVKEGKVFEVDHSDWSRRRSLLSINEIIPDLEKVIR